MVGPDNANLAADIARIVAERVGEEPESFTWEAPWSHGSIQHSERVFAVAQYAARVPGDLAEIGCMTGTMTARFGAIAQTHDRMVLGIDPWEKGTQNCEGWEYEAFLENIALVRYRIHILRARSQSKEALELLARPLCFAFVDGSHEYEDCLSDIMAVAHAPIICVDDILWNAAVRQAFEEGARQLNRQMITHEMAKEGYLV